MLLLQPSVCRAILEHARCALPLEACGLLIGRSTSAGHEALEWVPARNTNADPARRFDLEPGCFLRTERRARSLHQEIVGVVHSHPASPAWPSARDERFAWPELSSMIAAREGGHWVLRSFRLVGSRLREEPVAVKVGEKCVTAPAGTRNPTETNPSSAHGAPP